MKNKKFTLFSSKLGISITVIFVLTLALTVWGIMVGQSAKKQIADNAKLVQKELQSQQASQNSSPATQNQLNTTSPSSNSSSSSPSSTAKPGTSTSTSMNSSKSSAPPTVSDADKQKAYEQILEIHGALEAYNAQYGSYPSEANYATLSTVGANADAFTPPAGIHFVYKPSPGGCTTAAQNCTGYTLDALDSTGNPVAPQQKNLS